MATGPAAQAQSEAPAPAYSPGPPAYLLKAGLRLTHLSYSPGNQSWQVVVPLSLGAEYRLASRFSLYSQAEADLQARYAARTGRRRRQATSWPSTALSLGLRYYYTQPKKEAQRQSNNLYGNYLALEGNAERVAMTAFATATTRRATPARLTPSLYLFWGTQHRLRRALLYDASAGLGLQAPAYYNFETVTPTHYDVAAQVNLRVYWSRGFGRASQE